MLQTDNTPKKSDDNYCKNLWNEQQASQLTAEERLLYRSNLLGSDKKITNFGGGNTSSKIIDRDPLTNNQTEVLWVKGSGGDVGSMKLNGFATLYMDKLQSLKTIYTSCKDEDAMVALFAHCNFNLNTRAPSIDTPLHAYLPYRHVDHMHPDSIIAIAACNNSQQLTVEIFEGNIGWLPWKRPGFILGLQLEKFAQENPDKKGVILESHGLFTWADDAYQCYQLTIDTINQAQKWLDQNLKNSAAFGGIKFQSLAPDERKNIAISMMPVIRGLISANEYLVGHFVDTEVVLDFVNSKNFRPLAEMGTSCPDHFLRTKIRPLIIELDPKQPELSNLIETLPEKISDYRKQYTEYYERCKHQNSPPLRNPNPVIFLIPGVGMISFAKNKATARIAGEFYINAINVMRSADGVSDYMGLPEQEAFDIEYWLLEEAKLQRMPKAKSLAGQIALITGSAGGIGKATAEKLLQQGACVMLTDIDVDGLATVKQELTQRYGKDVVAAVTANITSEQDVISILNQCRLEFGGLDILVSNAGIASSAAIEDTSLEMWQTNMNILTTGYFLVSRESFKVFQQQKLPGAVVFVASKNGLVASPKASAYCTAKAAEIQLARTLALEGAAIGIRVNVVNPDAVLQGSKIWSGQWKQQRADAYQMAPEDLQEHYRNRSLLKRNVYPEDIAEAIYFLASQQSDKSTGNIINVDAGYAPAFTR